MKIASFDVDAQKGFTPLCPDELPVPGGDEIAAHLNLLARRATLRIGSKDAHSPSAPWAQVPRPASVAANIRFCRKIPASSAL